MWVKVHSAPNLTLAWLVREALQAEGIDARLQGEGRAGVAGEIPIPDAQIEVWVPRDAILRATGVLARLEDAGEAPAWTCACGEENPGSFEICWSCGKERGAG